MPNSLIRPLAVITLLSISLTLTAKEPVVLYETSDVITLESNKPVETKKTTAQNQESKGLNLPLSVPAITLALFERYPSGFDIKTPVCVIGSDDRSLSWLITYKEQLITLGASCLLVEAPDVESLARVAHYADGISVMPDIQNISVKTFKLKHYPALISKHWVEQ